MTERLWVFGYGSLIWNPCFPVERQVVARLDGWHRSFCMWSIHYRGTEDAPGLVLALDAAPGESCAGIAFLVTAGAEEAAMAELRARELVSSAYLETTVTVRGPEGVIDCIAYVIDPAHPQYCGGMPLADQAAIIARATGLMGPNRDYLHNTALHLDQLGIPDEDIHQLARMVDELSP
ncbi:gamma-glutamylcyclotransferase [Falsirhodobacter xinxiangensis]|uniref:gamma-glutamylcyclotransferase n=1 Tax=Falsirhodobacter xinxiangensis TaxID=2530049 RepID=UPI0010AB1050|nr:gamma-glutamylcyclotransferase [Rhodobacter xinxiangensis]